MRLVFLIAIALACASTGTAQDQPRPGIFDPFDRWFGKIPAEHERLRLDNFAIALQENPDWIGYILVAGGGRSKPADRQRHANRMKRWVVCFRKIPWDRVVAADDGTWLNGSVVTLQPIPKASLSQPFFEHFRHYPKPSVTRCNRRRSFAAAHNKSLDASGGSASRNLLGAAKGALICAAASTQTFGG